MTSDSPFIDEGEPPKLELPRLGIIHLLVWTAAVAIAFLPYRVQQETLSRASGSERTQAMRTASEAFGVVYGIGQGSYLFVTAALIYWKRRGLHPQREPGHVLAYQGAVLWCGSVVSQAIVALGVVKSTRIYFWIGTPQLLLGLIFFVWFLRLAFRPGETTAWRWAFGMFALAPIAGWCLMMAMFFATRAFSSGSVIYLTASSQGLATAVQAVTLALAMAGDWRIARPRHWTHWLSAGSRLVVTIAIVAYYGWLALFY